MKILHPSYTFDPATRTVTLTKLNIAAPQLLLVTNVTDGLVIYNFADAAKGYTSFTPGTNTSFVLEYDTTSMSAGDKLAIHYDDAKPSTTVGFTDAAICAFGRLRTSDPGYRFDSSFVNGIDTDLWDPFNVSSVISFDTTQRWASLTGGTASGNGAVLQSHYHAPYTPGRGQLGFITFLMGAAPATNAFKRVGYYDGTNGIYLERTSAAVNMVLKSSTSKGTETVAQASWNIDPMDGSGPSGLTLDLTKVQILVIQMQALYVGRAIVGFDIDGTLVPVHAFRCANDEAYPYIAQASLPVRYEVGVSGGSAGAAPVLCAICSSVISEGGESLFDIPGKEFVARTGRAGVSAPDTDAGEAVLIIRAKAQLGGVNQNKVTIPMAVDIMAATNPAFVRIVRNPTYGGATPTFADVHTSSVMEYSITDGVTITGGTEVDAFGVPASATTRTTSTRDIGGKAVLAYSHLLATGDTLAVVASGIGGASTVQAALKFRETA